MDQRKYVYVNNNIHHKLMLIKLYSNLEVSLTASELLSEALKNKAVLEVVLMKLLGNKQKIEHVLKLLRENE